MQKRMTQPGNLHGPTQPLFEGIRIEYARACSAPALGPKLEEAIANRFCMRCILSRGL